MKRAPIRRKPPAREQDATGPHGAAGLRATKGCNMGIDSESDMAADLQIGPTTLGMVRIFVAGDGFEIPLDFEPDEAIEIAEEIRAAAERARAMGEAANPAKKPGKPKRR